MGGVNSGRHGRFVSIEGTASYWLSAQSFNRAKIRRGIRGTTRLIYRDGFTIVVEIDTGNHPHLRLKHHTRDREQELIEYTVALAWTAPRFGGLRWWLICPATGRRCHKLYLLRGGNRFLSRQAYRLRYACQVETRLARLQRQSIKINRALGGDGAHDCVPERRKGMRQRTYERLAAKFERYRNEAEAEWSRGAMAFLERIEIGPTR